MRRFRRYQGRRRRRRYVRKARPYGGRFWSTAGKALATAGTALSIAKAVKSMVNVEYKVKQDSSGTFNIDTTGTTELLSGMEEGDDNTQRNGRSIKATSLWIKGKMYFNPAGTNYQRGRILLVQDMHGDGSTCALIDVLESASVDAFVNLQNTDRYKIHYNKEIILTAERPVYQFSKFIKKKSKLEFIGTSSIASSCGAGHYWLLTIGNVSSGSNPPTANYQWRMRYIDN